MEQELIELNGLEVLGNFYENYPDSAFKRSILDIIYGHPLMQILAYLKLYKHAIMVHDKTVPKPIGVRNDK